jgi:hypothetical protein
MLQHLIRVTMMGVSGRGSAGAQGAAARTTETRLGWRDRSRGLVLLTWLLFATGLFLWVVNHHYAIRNWLFLVYAQSWLGAVAFCAASLVGGWRIVAWILPRPPRLNERLLLALAAGVLTFYLGMFVAGIARWYGRFLFFAWPALMLLAGGPRFIKDARRIVRRLSRFGVRLMLPRTPV